MTTIRKYLAIALFFSGVSVCQASHVQEVDLEAQQRAPVVVHQQHTVSKTADAFLKHGAGDIGFLAVTGVRQLSDAEVFRLMFYGVQLARYYQLARTNYHATSDAMKYKTWPFVFFATAMVIHALGDVAFDLPSMSNVIRNSVILASILEAIPLINEITGASEAIITFAAASADSVKTLSVLIAALTFTLALNRFRHDGTLEVILQQLKSLLPGGRAFASLPQAEKDD